MIGIVYGTTGELIKLAPVISELRRRGQEPVMICTGQQSEQLPAFGDSLALPPADIWLARGHRGRDLSRKREILAWAVRVALAIARRHRSLRARLRADGTQPWLLVHGDTMTTVLGALAGRALGVKVAHIEAGLRSGDWRNPFPEELDRRIVARLADLHFAPGPRAVGNLRREFARGEVIDTVQNTICDAVAMVGDGAAPAVKLPEAGFGLVSLHRFELLEREEQLHRLLIRLHEHSRRQPLLFIDHSTTAQVIDGSARLSALFDDRFQRLPRQPYPSFIALLKRAEFLVTDSGGCQEETAFLGIPCLIHRAVSERDDGFGRSVLLSGLNLELVDSFLADPGRWRVAPVMVGSTPSRRIVDELQARGALGDKSQPAREPRQRLALAPVATEPGARAA